jgi:uncharacterized delta-60 repeat protein
MSRRFALCLLARCGCVLGGLLLLGVCGVAWSHAPLPIDALLGGPHRRVRETLADGSAWSYDWNDRNELVSAKRVWPDHAPVAGQQFEFGYDPIGNRTSARSGGADPTVYSVAVQSDGKVLIGGGFTMVSGANRNGIARLTGNGSLDSFNPGANPVRAIAVQGDGKVVIGGGFTTVAGETRNRIARLNSNGTLDSFQSGMAGADALVTSLLVQPDGKIVLGGEFTLVNGIARKRIGRLLGTNGSLDDKFRASTVTELASAGPNDTVWALAMDPNRMILIGGDFTGYRVEPPVPPPADPDDPRGRIARIGGL